MVGKLFGSVLRISPDVRKSAWQRVYQFLATRYARLDSWTFMNYGYEPLDPAHRPLLDAADEPNRYMIQLYHAVATSVNLAGLDVLEVGSGRGGGASYVKRYLKPQTMTGIDFSQGATEFSRQRHKVENLTFITGDAEALPFADDAFDAVINVESSHCYGSIEHFVAQVHRVLSPGGHFLFADFRAEEEDALLRAQLTHSGLEVVRSVDITPNVLAALDTYNDVKLAMIQNQVHWSMRGAFQNFAATKGTAMYEGFKNHSSVYHHYLLRKPSLIKQR